MNYIISANQESPFLTSLDSLKQSDVYSYEIPGNFPNSAIDVLFLNANIQPSNGNVHSSDLTFDLPRIGHFLTDAIIQSQIRPTTDQTGLNTGNIGCRLFSDITFRSHSSAIYSLTPEAMIAIQATLPSEKAYKHNQLTNPTLSWTSVLNPVVYTPIYSPFMESTNTYLPLSFVEKCQYTARVNTKAGMGLSADLFSMSCKLFVKFRNLQTEAFSAYLANNLPTNSLLNMVQWNTYKESAYSIANGDTSAVVDLKCPHPVFASHFYIYDSTKNLGPTTSTQISTVGMTFAGKPIMSDVPVSVLAHFNSRYSRGDISVATNGALSTRTELDLGKRGPYTIYWSELPNRTFNSGCVAMSNVNQPQLELSFSDPGSANFRVAVVHEYYQYAQINPVDGVISTLSSL